MKKKYIIEVDESEIIEYWSEQVVKEIGYQEYALKSCPNIKVKPYEERPQGDTISRSALKKELANLFVSIDYIVNKTTIADKEFAILSVIDNAPTLEIATKLQPNCNNLQQGEWIVLVDADNIQTCKCSICGRIADIANREFDKFPYCHCGAKMKGGADMRGEKE